MFFYVSTLPFPLWAVTWPLLVGPCAVVSVSGWWKLLGISPVGSKVQYSLVFLHVFLAPNIGITSQVIKMLKNPLFFLSILKENIEKHKVFKCFLLKCLNTNEFVNVLITCEVMPMLGAKKT